MSKIQFGLPLIAPSTQTIIPILDTYGKAFGFCPISSTTFEGTETTYTLPDGPIAITTVTLPPKVTNSYDMNPVSQYMAAVYTPLQTPLQPWLGYAEFVNAYSNQSIGYYSWWSMPTSGWLQHFGMGSFIESFKFNMDKYVYEAPAGQGAPAVTNGTMRWACTSDLAAFSSNYSFIDFNWLDLFAATLQQTPGYSPGQEVIPLSITTVSNPAGGFFKASVLQAQGAQIIVPGGASMFDTIRILRLADPTAGTYTFDFAVSDNLGNTTPVTLTLTVV
jgi:hypothetical protein